MRSTLDWLEEWFSRKGMLPGDSDAIRRINYFEAGLIDSMGVIELIEDCETSFGIRFEQRHFQDRRFATLGGLAEIISELS